MQSNIRKRIWNEIQDVNADFFNIRTVIAPDPDDDFSRFYFAMSPNDGLMAHMRVVGCFYIPDTYPESPPVVHLYTKTGRFNVDYFRNNVCTKTQSTLCFDILRSQAHGGTWHPDYTISSLFASLMSALVSFYVPQQSGPDIPEYVSMEKLARIKAAVMEAYAKHRHLLLPMPDIPLVKATMVPAMQMSFPDIVDSITVEDSKHVTSGPIYLQTSDPVVHTFGVDLSQLHSGIVFSVILSNSQTDITGRLDKTILVRNGVTATAARKRANEEIRWFYHGKPMNDGDMRLHVTIGRDQMTFAYYSNGFRYVLGDGPVSRLSPTQIGDVRGMPFYVHLYLKKKSGEPAKVFLLDTEGEGYIHGVRDEFDKDEIDEGKSTKNRPEVGDDEDLIKEMREMNITDNDKRMQFAACPFL